MNNQPCTGGHRFFTDRTMVWAVVCMAWSASAIGQEAASSAQPLDMHYRAETPVFKPQISVCEYRNQRQEHDKELQDSLANRGDGVVTTPVMTVTGKCPQYLDLYTFHNPVEFKQTVFDKYWKDKKSPKQVGMGGIPFDLTDVLLGKHPAKATPSPFDETQMDRQAKQWNLANPGLPQEVQNLDKDEQRQVGNEEGADARGDDQLGGNGLLK